MAETASAVAIGVPERVHTTPKTPHVPHRTSRWRRWYWSARRQIERPAEAWRAWKIRKYPPALAKACMDPFEYALRLRTGELWYFEEARPIDQRWVQIKIKDPDTYTGLKCHDNRTAVPGSPVPLFDRNVDVRISDIVWVADAPYGS